MLPTGHAPATIVIGPVSLLCVAGACFGSFGLDLLVNPNHGATNQIPDDFNKSVIISFVTALAKLLQNQYITVL
jgi:hypothetical protein